MKYVFGLGNPGKKYHDTRHNTGFGVIAVLAERFQVRLKAKTRLEAMIGECVIADQKTMLVEPLTYMNESGYAVTAVLDYYGGDTDDIIIVYDDIDLPFGSVRIRAKGSAGTHNGMRSIVQYLGTEDFVRVRLGIGRPEGRQPLASYVLSRFPDTFEARQLIKRGADAVECILQDGIAAAQQKFHEPQKQPDADPGAPGVSPEEEDTPPGT